MTTVGSMRAIAPLLAAITLAEEISRDVTARQALLAPRRLRQTLRRQSWQEAAHAALFRSALQCIPGQFPCPAPVEAALQDYAARLHSELDRGHLALSMVGLHCVLEGFAAVALQAPPGLLASTADALVPLRSFILHQEQAHQRLGEVWAPRLLPDAQALARSAGDYCALSAALLEAGLTEFVCLHDEAGHYRCHVERHLRAAVRKLEHPDGAVPSWRTEDGVGRCVTRA